MYTEQTIIHKKEMTKSKSISSNSNFEAYLNWMMFCFFGSVRIRKWGKCMEISSAFNFNVDNIGEIWRKYKFDTRSEKNTKSSSSFQVPAAFCAVCRIFQFVSLGCGVVSIWALYSSGWNVLVLIGLLKVSFSVLQLEPVKVLS